MRVRDSVRERGWACVCVCQYVWVYVCVCVRACVCVCVHEVVRQCEGAFLDECG